MKYLYRFIRLLCILAVFMGRPARGNASEGKPFSPARLEMSRFAACDTTPPAQKPPPDKKEEPDPAPPTAEKKPIVKSVPKARKQVKPVAIPTLPVKPVKVIKPVIKKIGNLL